MNTVHRVGVFETNSSSSHSISIAPINSRRNTLARISAEFENTLAKGETVEIIEGEFGWGGPEYYYDAWTKASYALTYANHYAPGKLEMLRRIIKGSTSCKVTFGGPEGYIDHQSSDVCEEAFESDEKLMSFIFNHESELIIDHDNH